MNWPLSAEKLTAVRVEGAARTGISLPSLSIPSSCPYRGRDASSRSVSRAPRPTGTMPSLPESSSSQIWTAFFAGTKSSKHRGSPVYPVRETISGALVPH